jgi:two-component system cell cycle sensor histidine kinase/response regulator CckA
MRRSRETILIVHEDDALRAHVSRVLSAEGYTAIPSRHSVEAQWCVERSAADVHLLLIDLVPPAWRDYHLGISLSALWAHTPVIFTAPDRREESIRRGLLHPHAPFLQAPFPPRVLTRTVRSVLDRQQSRLYA